MNSDLVIREARLGDEVGLIELFSSLYKESDFLLMESGEFTLTIERQAEIIKEVIALDSKILLVAEMDKVLVGFLGGTGGSVNRNRHSISIAMGVLKESQRNGIGLELLSSFERWAAQKQFHRLELTVIDTNINAKSLYKRAGFEEEGVKRHALKVNDCYVNELYMSKLI